VLLTCPSLGLRGPVATRQSSVRIENESGKLTGKEVAQSVLVACGRCKLLAMHSVSLDG